MLQWHLTMTRYWHNTMARYWHIRMTRYNDTLQWHVTMARYWHITMTRYNWNEWVIHMWKLARHQMRRKIMEKAKHDVSSWHLPSTHTRLHTTSPRIIAKASILSDNTRSQGTPGPGERCVLGWLRAAGGVFSFLERQLVTRETISKTKNLGWSH